MVILPKLTAIILIPVLIGLKHQILMVIQRTKMDMILMVIAGIKLLQTMAIQQIIQEWIPKEIILIKRVQQILMVVELVTE
ncbi:hypothetical protein ABN83_04030 [Haemophilus influenzae]|nr:hypothetical protein ABN83_04030 [Haemophilus influenzae]